VFLRNSFDVQIQHVTLRIAGKGESWDDEISTISAEDDAKKSEGTLDRKPLSTKKTFVTQNEHKSSASAKANATVPRTIEAFVETEEEASGRLFLA
jgi:hypothetical protein